MQILQFAIIHPNSFACAAIVNASGKNEHMIKDTTKDMTKDVGKDLTKDLDKMAKSELTVAIRSVRLASVGWHIQRLSSQLDTAMNSALAPHGLTLQQFAIVMMLAENDGLNQTEIGSRFSALAYTVTRAIDGLEADGFLERRPHPTSRRTNTVHATAKTLALMPVLVGIISDVNARLLAALDKQERERMQGLLVRVLGENGL